MKLRAKQSKSLKNFEKSTVVENKVSIDQMYKVHGGNKIGEISADDFLENDWIITYDSTSDII